MSLLEEIRNCFAGLASGQAIKINAVGAYPAWALRMNGWYGVAVDCAQDQAPVSLSFASSSLKTEIIDIAGVAHNVLVLSSKYESYRNEFAAVCAQFIYPGTAGSQRKIIVQNPIGWWERWRSLLGNAVRDEESYSTIAELLACEYLLKGGKKPVWSGANNSTHDIETEENDYEVKATIARYGCEITLSSQFQLDNHGKKLNLLFFRLEPSLTGETVDAVVERLASLGMDSGILESKLAAKGLEKGSYARTTAYHCLEMRNYAVDEQFPAITEKSFKDDVYPKSLIGFSYTVTLDGLTYTTEI